MILKNFIFIFIFIQFIYISYCFKGFTIDTEGKNVSTAKISNQGECTSIAFTEKGTLIKYKSDSSIISTYEFPNKEILSTDIYYKSFMCQYSTNKVIVTRDKKIFEIEFASSGDDILKRIAEAPSDIISLHCNLNNYIYTYLSSNSKQYNFKISNKNLISKSYSNTILSSSCFLLSSSLVLCINIIKAEKKIQYVYHNLQSSSSVTTRNIDLSDDAVYKIYEIKGSIIKYYSNNENNEILLCLSVKPELISDIFLYCYMLSANTNQKNLEIKSSNSIVFKAIEKIEGDVNYCQIEKISSNFYASVCLSYYYRTTYLLSLFKFNDDKFEIYTYNSGGYKNLQFALLKRSQISLLIFNENSLGIFYRDIDDDSMIHVFYPNCGKNLIKYLK